MDIAIIMGLFFLFCTMVFVFAAIFMPELVGITGKRAHEITKTQQAENPAEDSTAAEAPKKP